MKTTLTEQLILGILSESPQHGYNIEKLIEKRGMQVLQDETKNLISIRKPSNTHLMTGLSNSHIISEDEMKNSLKQRKIHLEEDLNSLQFKMSNDKKLPILAQRLFSLSETLIKAELEWIYKELKRSKNKIEP